MRQVISWRFVAAIGAVVGLALFVNVAFADRGTIAEVVAKSVPSSRRADLVALVLTTDRVEFSMSARGTTEGDLTMTLTPPERTVRVFPGTPGVITCEDLDKPCALLAETLGDTIMWFALVPMGPNFQFELPPIESLDGGFATLVNGWQVEYAPIIDRTPCDSPAESFSEFLRLVGPAHRAVYNLGRSSITSVVC